MVTTCRGRRRNSQSSSHDATASTRRHRHQGQPENQRLPTLETTPVQQTASIPTTASPVVLETHVDQLANPVQPAVEEHPLLVGINAVLDELRKQNQSLQH